MKCTSKEGLAFDKRTGEIKYWYYSTDAHNYCKIVLGDIGFTSLGDITSQLKTLEDEPIANPLFPPELLANSTTTSMVRGLFLNIQFPYVYFPSRKVMGYMLFNRLWDAVTRLERCGFKVIQQ